METKENKIMETKENKICLRCKKPATRSFMHHTKTQGKEQVYLCDDCVWWSLRLALANNTAVFSLIQNGIDQAL